MIIRKEAIEHYEKLYRTTFINSLAGFRQAVLVGTRSEDGYANLAIFNSLIHLGANPALFGLMSRPGTVQRDTLQNILETGAYTLNYIPASYYKQAHQTSARYDRNISEFVKTGFHEVYQPGFAAPFVEESPVKIAMKFEEKVDIPISGTVLLIGSILQVELDNSMVNPEGFVELSAGEIVISQGLDAYFISQELGRLAYAKP